MEVNEPICNIKTTSWLENVSFCTHECTPTHQLRHHESHHQIVVTQYKHQDPPLWWEYGVLAVKEILLCENILSETAEPKVFDM